MILKINQKTVVLHDNQSKSAHSSNNVVTNEKEKMDMERFANGKKVKSKKRLKRILTTVYLTAFAVCIDATTTYAEASTAALSTDEQSVMSDIDGVLLKIQLICAGISVGIAILMAMIAGFFRMIGLREEAKRRYMDAIAGMTMVLTAPVVLGIIATIVRGLIKLFPNYAA